MEMTEIEQLIDLLKTSNVRELTLRNGDSRITLKKSPFETTVQVGSALVPYQLPAEQMDLQQLDADVRDTSYAYGDGLPLADSKDDIEEVTAPLVGIFHHVKPLIGPGASVSAGQVVAVIEAMNLITEVTSPVSGTVTEAVIKDGMPSEYGQTLFLVKAER
jgi:acetyl-CoA carboxylase biotin carboxyl carrier protein